MRDDGEERSRRGVPAHRLLVILIVVDVTMCCMYAYHQDFDISWMHLDDCVNLKEE